MVDRLIVRGVMFDLPHLGGLPFTFDRIVRAVQHEDMVMQLHIRLPVFGIDPRVAMRHPVRHCVPRDPVLVLSTDADACSHLRFENPHHIGNGLPVGLLNSAVTGIVGSRKLTGDPNRLRAVEGEIHADTPVRVSKRPEQLAGTRIEVVAELVEILRMCGTRKPENLMPLPSHSAW